MQIYKVDSKRFKKGKRTSINLCMCDLLLSNPVPDWLMYAAFNRHTGPLELGVCISIWLVLLAFLPPAPCH